MKKINSITFGLTMILVLLLSACGLLDAEGPTIIGSNEVSVGQTFTLIAITPATGDQEIDAEGWTWDNVEYPASGQIFQASEDEWVVISMINLTAPETPGTYIATYTITLVDGEDTWTGDANFEVEVVEVDEPDDQAPETTENCPAAPAIATDYMRSIGVRPGSQEWRTVVTSVAHETGVNGDLWAGESCDPDYRQRVIDFVDNLLAQ